MRLLEQLNSALPARDTGRGLVATIAGTRFTGTMISQASMDQLARVASIMAAHPELRIEVEGNTDSPDTAAVSQRRAEVVRDILVARGLSPSTVTARGLGNSRPLGSNATPAGREQNQRVEIVISGDAIGNVPSWDRPYSLTSRN
jgi:flagellar motor protein MotB